MSESAVYMYALARSDGWQPTSLRGVDDQPVRTVSTGPLSCIVSTVSLDQFGEQALQRNLEDLAWLERPARQHDAIVHE